MVRKTLMSLLFASSVAVVPVAFAEGGSSGSGTGSSSTYGSGSDSSSGSGMGGSSSSGMGTDSSSGTSGSDSTSGAYERECITAAQKRTQRCMDLQRMQESGTSGSGPSSSGSSDGTSSGMGSGSSTTSPTVP